MTVVEDLSFILSTTPTCEQHPFTELTPEFSLRQIFGVASFPNDGSRQRLKEAWAGLSAVIRYNLHRYAHHLLSVLVLTTFLATSVPFCFAKEGKTSRLNTHQNMCLPAIIFAANGLCTCSAP